MGIDAYITVKGPIQCSKERYEQVYLHLKEYLSKQEEQNKISKRETEEGIYFSRAIYPGEEMFLPKTLDQLESQTVKLHSTPTQVPFEIGQKFTEVLRAVVRFLHQKLSNNITYSDDFDIDSQ